MRKYIVYFCSIFLLAGCSMSSSDDPDQKNFELHGEEKAEIIGEFNESIMDSVDREDVEEYVEIIESMADRAHYFPAGRYEIAVQGSGVIYIFDEQDNLVFREVMAYGIDTIMVDIKEGYSMRVNSFTAVAVAQVETKMSNDLFPGIWEVGTDIEAGNYTVSGIGYGHLQIFDPTEEPRVFEVIGNPYVSTTSSVQLHDGQKLKINGLMELNFKPSH